jgi:large subunit ribosomal protein L6
VTITVNDSDIVVAGSKGTLTVPRQTDIDVAVEGDKIVVTRKNEEASAKHGLERALLNNAVIGVTKGFEKKLEINGVGFRLGGGGDKIEMSLGFSHPVKYQAPQGVQLGVNKMEITVSGIDKQLVGQFAAEVRDIRRAEPYLGKGIKYEGEVIRRKESKAATKK